LGRWQTPDPYGQHYSPYLAMSNNPVSFTDPDGGYDKPSWLVNGQEENDEEAWRDYHRSSKREMQEWNQRMRQTTNPEYYAEQLIAARLANGKELSMADMVISTMLRYYQRHPERGESEDYHYESYYSGCEGCILSESGQILAPEDPFMQGGARIVHEKTDAYIFWLNSALTETKKELWDLVKNDHRFATAVVQNTNLSDKTRAKALVHGLRNDPFSKAVHTLITMVLPIPAVGAATGGGRALFMAGRVATRTRVLRALPHAKNLFKADEAVVHFEKHGKSIMNALGESSYNLGQYVNDANHVIRTGTWAPEMNAFVKLIGGRGTAKFAVVGLEQGTSTITTFHIKTAREIARKAPGLGIVP